MQLRSKRRQVEDVVCTGRCGVALCDKKPFISYDANTLFVPSGSLIRQFSLASGEPLKTLRFHQSFIVAITPYARNRVQCLSCSVDGRLFRWDSLDCSVISEHRLVQGETKVQVFVASQLSPFVAYVTHLKVEGVARNTLYIRNVDELSENPREISNTCTTNGSLYAFAAQSDLMVWAEQENVALMHCSSPSGVRRIRCRSKPTCIAVHPINEIVAVGDVDGAIHVHTAPFNHTGMKLHWHTLSVADLHLSSNFLYSVGSEGVLVRWDLESEDRQFLPRLGLPIKFVSVAQNEKYVVCSHCDNTLTVVVAPNTVHRVLQGLIQRSYSGDSPSELGLLYDPARGHLVVSGRPGQLQFYDLEHERQVRVVDVTGENFATDFKLQYQLMKGINSEVILADFSPDGKHLATVEFRTTLSSMSKLKFWRWNEETGEFVVNTNVLMPHLKHRLRACKLGRSDGRYFCVTAADRSFKLWTIVQGGDQIFWQSVEERDFRRYACNNLALSEDHTILAASFGHIITLWQIQTGDTLNYLGELCVQGELHHVTSLEFCRGSCSNVLLAANHRSISAWDVFSLDRVWSSSTVVKQLIVDPQSENIAAITIKPNRCVVIFHPEHGIEAPVSEIALNQEDQIRCGVFVPQKLRRGKCSEVPWQSSSSLLVMGKRDKLFHFVLKKYESSVEDELSHDVVDSTSNVASLVTPFGSHLISLAERRTESDQKSARSTSYVNSSRFIEQILQTPTHVMPSASLLVEGLLSSFLGDDEEEDSPELMDGSDMNSRPASDSEDGSETESARVKPKKSKISENDVIKTDLVEQLRNSVKLDKVKLPKLKDYEWIRL